MHCAGTHHDIAGEPIGKLLEKKVAIANRQGASGRQNRLKLNITQEDGRHQPRPHTQLCPLAPRHAARATSLRARSASTIAATGSGSQRDIPSASMRSSKRAAAIRPRWSSSVYSARSGSTSHGGHCHGLSWSRSHWQP